MVWIDTIEARIPHDELDYIISRFACRVFIYVDEQWIETDIDNIHPGMLAYFEQQNRPIRVALHAGYTAVWLDNHLMIYTRKGLAYETACSNSKTI